MIIDYSAIKDAWSRQWLDDQAVLDRLTMSIFGLGLPVEQSRKLLVGHPPAGQRHIPDFERSDSALLAIASRYRIQTPATLDIARITIHDQSVFTTFDRRKARPTIVLHTFHLAKRWLTSVCTLLIEAKHG